MNTHPSTPSTAARPVCEAFVPLRLAVSAAVSAGACAKADDLNASLVRAFLAHFATEVPTMQVNDNCATDLACPHCGARGEFSVAATSWVQLDDSGTDDRHASYEWEATSEMVCSQGRCSFGGTVADFTFPGLDGALSAAQSAGVPDHVGESGDHVTDDPTYSHCPFPIGSRVRLTEAVMPDDGAFTVGRVYVVLDVFPGSTGDMLQAIDDNGQRGDSVWEAFELDPSFDGTL